MSSFNRVLEQLAEAKTSDLEAARKAHAKLTEKKIRIQADLDAIKREEKELLKLIRRLSKNPVA